MPVELQTCSYGTALYTGDYRNSILFYNVKGCCTAVKTILLELNRIQSNLVIPNYMPEKNFEVLKHSKYRDKQRVESRSLGLACINDIDIS